MCYDYFIAKYKKNNMNINSQLQSLGLDDKETEIYSLLLKIGGSSISQILKLTKIKKGDLYNVLYRLAQKNLIEKKDNLFSPFNPEALIGLLQKEKQEIISRENLISDLLPSLLDLYEKSSNELNYQIYKEAADIRKNYLQVLQSNKKKFFFFSNIDLFNDYFYKNSGQLNRSQCQLLLSFEINKNNLEKITRILKRLKTLPKNLELRFIAVEQNSFDENIYLFDNQLFLFKKKENLFSLKIINDELSLFNLRLLSNLFKFSFNLEDLMEIILLPKHTIFLQEDNLFSKKFLWKNRKLLSEKLLEKLNLLK